MPPSFPTAADLVGTHPTDSVGVMNFLLMEGGFNGISKKSREAGMHSLFDAYFKERLGYGTLEQVRKDFKGLPKVKKITTNHLTGIVVK